MFLNGLLYNKRSEGYSCTDKYYCALADEAQKATRKIFNLTKEDDVCHYVDKKAIKQRKEGSQDQSTQDSTLVMLHILQHTC